MRSTCLKLLHLTTMFLMVLIPTLITPIYTSSSLIRRQSSFVKTIPENQHLNSIIDNKHNRDNQQLIQVAQAQENNKNTAIRNIYNYKVSDILLVSDVEGGLSALKRQTGEIIWSIHGNSPLVEVSKNYSEYHQEQDDNEDDTEWMVEPYGPGALYYFRRESGLTKIPSTIDELVMSSPISINNGDRVFTGVRSTALYTIDLRTGDFLSTYGAWSCVADNSCSSDEDDVPIPISLGKTTFELKIHSKRGKSWNITYSTWGPNNVDFDLVSQNKNSLDGLVFSPFSDNSLLATFDDQKRKVKWKSTLNNTIVNIFDIIDDYRLNENYQFEHVHLCLPHPLKRGDGEKDSTTFLGLTKNGSWYALGNEQYSLLVKSSFASKYSLSERWRATYFTNSHEELQEAIIGVHFVNDAVQSSTFGLIGYPQNTPHPIASSSSLLIPSVPTPGSNDLQLFNSADRSTKYAVTSSSPALLNPSIPKSRSGFFDTPFGKFLFDCFYACLIGCIISLFVVATLVALRKLRLIPSVNEGLQMIGLQLRRVDNPITIAGNVKSLEQLEKERTEDAGKTTNLEVINDSSNDQINNEAKQDHFNDDTDSLNADTNSDEIHQTKKKVKIVEPELDEKVSSDPSNGFKKRKRGSRGGKKNKKKSDGDLELMKTPFDKEKKPEQESHVQMNNGLTLHEDCILGYGSYGTVVYKGTFQNRDVAVKRMLMDFYDVANREISLLTESDDHPNVIRYFFSETQDKFLHIALELCSATLEDVIEKPYEHPDLLKLMHPANVLEQIAKGLHHLHSLKIVHRDIKPQNILVAPPKRLKTKEESFSPVRILISDFGLCKKLESDESSFKATTQHAAGTSGWRAPELLLDTSFSQSIHSDHSFNTSTNSIVEPVVFDTFLKRKLTRAIDIFSLGCVFFYILSNGGHPFGDRYMREGHIIKNLYSLEALDILPENNEESKDLISKMISYDPKLRPNTKQVLAHPYFWSKAKKLEFLLKVSDRFEIESRDPPSELLQELESVSINVFGSDWCSHFEKMFIDNLGKYRKYHSDRLMDLLRAIRNKYHHFNEIPDELAPRMSPLPDGFYEYFNKRFPKLLMEIYYVVEKNLKDDHVLETFF